ncbi:MAG: hypothetical protein KBB55_00105 [Candidatus Buchananbacteria bacterium]|nr:hypothetical protein [Candidatus Buchananbacteria bacterium]
MNSLLEFFKQGGDLSGAVGLALLDDEETLRDALAIARADQEHYADFLEQCYEIASQSKDVYLRRIILFT